MDAVACASGASSFLLGTSDGSFGDPVVYGTGVRFFVLRDLNGDHLADVVTGGVDDILLTMNTSQ